FCTLAPTCVDPTPSMVVIARSPIEPTGSKQERTGSPSICTVHAPHRAMPQPNFVPVMPSTSRSTHKSGVSSATSTLCVFPFTLRLMARASSLTDEHEQTRRSPLLVRVEDVVLALYRHMACVPAIGGSRVGYHLAGRDVMVELGVSPAACVRKPLAVLLDE